jgi:hypothetical protein
MERAQQAREASTQHTGKSRIDQIEVPIKVEQKYNIEL